MLELSNIPNEIYYMACVYEKIDIKPEQLEEAKEIYEAEINSRHFTDGGLEKAICEYLTMTIEFDQENGMFNYCNGYTIK